MKLAGIFGIAAAAALSACSSGDDTAAQDAGAQTDTAMSSCATDPRVMTYAVGLEQTGKSGLVKVKILDANPAPPAKGDNTWSIEVTDASGAKVDGATISLTPFMPDHGHGASITPEVKGEGSGTYTVTKLSLFMPGVWTLTFDVKAAAGEDQVAFAFCVAS